MIDTEKLKGAVVAAGLTQAEIADKIGLSPTAFNNKVTNKTEFKASEIAKIVSLLNLSEHEISCIFFCEAGR